MHIMIVADGRSPTTRRWIASLRELGYRLTLVSSFPCAPVAGIEAMYVLPVAFAGFAGNQAGPGAANPTRANQGPRRAVANFRSVFLSARYFFGPLTLGAYGQKLNKMVENLRPDLVHSMRIPFEGMLASAIPKTTPLVVSIWGNDLTLHASGSMIMKDLTRRVLQRANGLIADTRRDIRLGRAMGFSEENPALVVPGSGGINLDEIERIRLTRLDPLTDFVPAGVPLVVNPRGFRPGSVRNDVFFESIPLVLKRNPRVAFLCPAMASQPEAMRAIEHYGLKRSLYLLPHLPQPQLWDLFLRATMMASISQHDGTPNSLLEAMACGCFPVAGDIESIREWITPGVNGLLVEPSKAASVADAILTALDNPDLRRSAAEVNKKLIASQADVNLVREKVKTFYEGLC
jgi:glycosyltransferase involved in cell wall biosynthesis